MGRRRVPCSFQPDLALDGFCKHYGSDSDVTVLEVIGVPETWLDRFRGRIDTAHLHAKHLCVGIFKESEQVFEDVPCPFCGGLCPDKAAERGKVGWRRFIKHSFIASPCCIN